MQSLESIGLTKNESITYLTLLKLGTVKTGTILKESGLNSGKIYEILNSLKQKGLVSETIVDNVKHFTSAPPKQLLQYMQQRKNSLEKEVSIVESIIPDLENIQKSTLHNKRIVTYSGFRGVMTAAEEALEQTENGEEIVSLGISDINAWSQDYWLRWEKMRLSKKISARYILSQKEKIYSDLKTVDNVKVKLLNADTPVGIDIYGKDILLILHYQDPVTCTMIYDEHTVTTFKSYFEILWNVAK